MRANVDRDLCIGCGLCESICPQVFKLDDEGKSHALLEEVPEDLASCAQEAEEQCPVDAIEVK